MIAFLKFNFSFFILFSLISLLFFFIYISFFFFPLFFFLLHTHTLLFFPFFFPSFPLFPYHFLQNILVQSSLSFFIFLLPFSLFSYHFVCKFFFPPSHQNTQTYNSVSHPLNYYFIKGERVRTEKDQRWQSSTMIEKPKENATRWKVRGRGIPFLQLRDGVQRWHASALVSQSLFRWLRLHCRYSSSYNRP